MTLNLKTEIEKINKGCGKNLGAYMEIPKEYENASDKIRKQKSFSIDVICGNQELCPSCQKYKQGLIQGAKMIIEEIRRISEEYFNEEYYHDFPKEPFETLKQLNNWLEKE